MNSKSLAPKAIIIWLLSGCVLIYLMVLIGGITRLTQSGLSMVTWSPAGSLPPSSDQEWEAEFDKYKQSPEFNAFNQHFTVDDFKQIYFWEFLHRFTGRLIGLVFFLPFVWFILKKKFPPGYVRRGIILLLVGSLQGLLGWYMVKSGLVKNPHVSHYRLAAHLITALLAFGLTFWYALDLIHPQHEHKKPIHQNYYYFTFLLLMLQIIWGAFVAGLKAGYIFPTFPKMGENWLPPDNLLFQQNPAWLNFIEGAAGVQLIHRYLGILVLIAFIFLYIKIRKAVSTYRQLKLSKNLALIAVLQVILGIITLVFEMPVATAVLHQTGAFILYAGLLWMIHRRA